MKLLAVIVPLSFLFLSACDELDACLDAGGGWDEELEQCICTDQERKKYGNVSENEAIKLCAADYETLKSKRAKPE